MVWALTVPGGKLMPVDRWPAEGAAAAKATIALSTTGAGGRYARVLTSTGEPLRSDESLHITHFATCAGAGGSHQSKGKSHA